MLGQLEGVHRLIGLLLYGSGLRLMECLELRVKDVDLMRQEIRVRRGKGQKDRVTLLPEAAAGLLGEHLIRVKLMHDKALAAGTGGVVLPGALARKYPRADRSWPWQWVFPARQTYADPDTGELGGTICTRRRCSGRWPRRSGRRAWESGRAVIRSGTRSPRTCSRRGTTSGRCRSSWATMMSAPR